MTISTTPVRNIINALRTGVIPDSDCELFFAGRETELLELKSCLRDVKNGSGVVKFIAGDYGSGKTFMLNLIKQLAIKDNFIVSKIQINNGFYLNNLSTLYYNIMHNIAVGSSNTEGTDFQGIFELWLAKLQEYTDRSEAARELNNAIAVLNNYNDSFARAFMAYIKAKINKAHELSNAASSWIMGEKNVPAAIKAKFDVKGDIDKQNSMDFLKAFSRLTSLLGYNGMIILIDELELVMNIRADFRRNSYENLRYIIDSIGSGEFGKCMFVFAGTKALFENEETGVKTYDALFQRLGRIDFNNKSFGSNLRQPVLPLGKMNFDNLLLLTDKIVKLHTEAYGWLPKNSTEAIRNWTLLTLKNEGTDMHNINTREYVVKLIGMLDLVEQNPGISLYSSELNMVEKNGSYMFINAKLT